MFDLLPNLWCIYRLDLNPTLVAIEEPFVAFTLVEDNINFGLETIYASIFCIRIKDLWSDLARLNIFVLYPWVLLETSTQFWVFMSNVYYVDPRVCA